MILAIAHPKVEIRNLSLVKKERKFFIVLKLYYNANLRVQVELHDMLLAISI